MGNKRVEPVGALARTRSSDLVAPEHAASPDELSGRDLCTAISSWHLDLERSRLDWLRWLAALDAREEWRGTGVRDTEEWVQRHCNVEPGEARRLVHLARSLESHPEVEAAVAAGELNLTQADTVVDAVEAVEQAATSLFDGGDEEPRLAPATTKDAVTGALLAAAKTEGTSALRRAARRVKDEVAAASADPDEARHQQRYVSLKPDDGSGMWLLNGRLTSLVGEKIRVALDALIDHDRRPDDTRDRGQRTADALLALADAGGATVKTHVTLVCDVRTLTATPGAPAPRLGSGQRVSVETARQLFTQADISPLLVDGPVPLYLGRTTRFGTKHQRVAVNAIYPTCVVDRCDTPSDRCQLAHTTPWHRGGPTDADTLVPACPKHHKIVDNGSLPLHRDPTTRRWRAAPPDAKGERAPP